MHYFYKFLNFTQVVKPRVIVIIQTYGSSSGNNWGLYALLELVFEMKLQACTTRGVAKPELSVVSEKD